jgi:pimeloyl-ACP methyl ester carboxylesterase
MGWNLQTLLGVFLQLLCAIASSAADDGVACRQHVILVGLAPGGPASYTVTGELCATSDELAAGATVQLLVHGATHNHNYWNFGRVGGIRYSYARDVAARGFPTFALDGIGLGNSSHPASDQVSAQASAYVVHQVVQALRSGSINDVAFGKVIIVGHSLGSTVVWQEAISFGDVDGVIVTGAAHSLSAFFAEMGPKTLYPANLDAKFSASGLDSGYLTTLPNSRAALFHSSPDVDPALIAVDETRKDVVSSTELDTGIPLVFSMDTLAIKVPVLTVLGGNDATTCGPSSQGGNFDCSSGAIVATQEAPFYSPEARIHACVVPASGHDLSLAVNHGLQTADAVAWSIAFVGQLDFGEKRRPYGSNENEPGLPWNDGLPWNCGAVSAGSR